MNPIWTSLLENLGGRIDEELLPRLYDALGLRTADVRAELADEGLAFHDPATGREPVVAELNASAAAVIARATRAATVGGAFAGFAGAIALPPEMIAALVQTLRLGQRLAVVFGHDPDTDRGRLLLWRAVAAAWELELATQGALDLRLHALPELLRAQILGKDSAYLGRTLTLRLVVTLGRRTLRMLPGVGAGLGAWDARRRMRGQGERMLPVFQRAWDGVLQLEGPSEDAVEV